MSDEIEMFCTSCGTCMADCPEGGHHVVNIDGICSYRGCEYFCLSCPMSLYILEKDGESVTADLY